MKNNHRMLSLLLILVLICAMLPAPVHAAATAKAISTPAELYAVRNDLDGNYYLTKDIVFTEADFAEGGAYYNGGAGWLPIGDNTNPFTGTFDGKGFSIKGLRINYSENITSYLGLFGVNSGSISNLTTKDGVYTATGPNASKKLNLGGIAGRVYNGNVENCKNENSFLITFNYGYGYIGGIAGSVYGTDGTGQIIGCENAGKIETTMNTTSSQANIKYIGGIVGELENSGSKVLDCGNNGKIAVSGANTVSYYLGGVVGNSEGTISGSYNAGEIICGYSCVTFMGGITGRNYHTVYNCSNSGALSSSFSSSVNIGGIVGINKYNSADAPGDIINCNNSGKISILPTSMSEGNNSVTIGGIAADNNSQIEYCYNTGTIDVDLVKNDGNDSSFRVGGIAGKCEFKAASKGINTCYNNGEISVSADTTLILAGMCGGIVGENTGIFVKNTYNTAEINVEAYVLGTHEIPFVQVGGIVGYNKTKTLSGKTFGSVESSYNAGSFNVVAGKLSAETVDTCTGGVVGWTSATVTDCYYLNNTDKGIGNDATGEATACTSSQLTQAATFEDFDFTNVWTMAGSSDYLYPELQDVTMVAPRTISKIEMYTTPKTTYYVGDALDVSGGKIKVIYSDASYEIVDITADMVSGFTGNSYGPCTLTVSYAGKTTNYDAFVYAVYVTQIDITKLPDKRSYYVGDSFSKDGGQFIAYYNNGTSRTFNFSDYGVTVSGWNMNKAGTQTVTVSYNNQSTYYTINVQAVQATSIFISTKPTKTSYYAGDTIDVSGGKIKVTYNNGTTTTIAMTASMVSRSPLTTNNTSVTVTYQGCTTSYSISVRPVLMTSIAVTKLPTKTTYFMGDTFSAEGGELTITYNNGTTKVVSLTDSDVTVHFPGSYSAGTHNIPVVHKDYIDTTAYFSITIKAIKPASITLSSVPTKTEYNYGEELDLSGGMITVTNNNGSTTTVGIASATVTGYQANQCGTQTVTLTYEGCTTNFTVTVGHDWHDANCTTPKSCSVCPATEGDPNPVAHKFDDENVCEYCGSTGGQCGDTLYWALNSQGLLTIYGEGAMYDYDYYDNPSPLSQNSSIKEIIVYSGSSIGELAFLRCENLTSVTIHDGVTSIGLAAFAECSNLSKVIIPASVTSIGSSAFAGCAFKSAGPIGGDYDYQFGWTTAIPANAFTACIKLDSVVIPERVTSIGELAFAGCEALSQITIPSSVSTMGRNVFSGTAIKSAGPIGGDYDCQFGWTATIPENAFSGCKSLESVVFPDSISSIGDSAFNACAGLVTVELPRQLTTIGVAAFAGCESLVQITLPDGVITLGSSAFSDCGKLADVVIPASVTTMGSNVFYHTAIKSAGPIGGDYDCRFGWTTTIPANAFYFCDSLESVVIPEGITSIGEKAFYSSRTLSSVIIPESVVSIGSMAFTSTNIKTAGPIGGDYDCQFGWTTTIPANAFNHWNKLESVVIPEGTTTIGEKAFFLCEKLTAVIIPASVTTIEDGAFYASSVTELQFLGSQPDMYNALLGLTTTAKHPCSWKNTPENCGGTITWVPVHGTYAAKVTPPTCTEDGYTTHTCSGCGDSYTDTPVPATDHSWKEATCIDPKTCSVCDTTEGDPLGHSFNRNILKPEALKSAATCVDPAVYFKSCSCGEISTDEKDIFEYGTAKGHSFNQKVTKTETLKSAATCVDPAVYYLSCSCGEISTDEKDIFEYGTGKGHSFNQEVPKTETLKSAATCVDPAVYYLSCSCGEISADEKDTFEYGTAKGHTFNQKVTKTETLKSAATCVDPAVYFKSCSCGEISTDEKDIFEYGTAKGHSFNQKVAKTETLKSAAACVDPAVYYLSCSCGEISTDEKDIFEHGTAKGHTWKDATCSDPKTCSVCGTTEGAAKGHSWKDATCSDPKTCSVCGTTEGAAKGHSWKDATCSDPKTCSVCGSTEGAAKGHSWKDATCSAPKTCSVCGSTEGAAKDHNYSNGFCGACGESDPNYVPAPPASGSQRLAGNTRYATAIEAADELKTLLGVDKFSSIIVSSGENFADALAGSYLASVKDAPILLVKSSTIKTVKEYIKSNLIPGGTVYLLGGVSAVPAAMESGLDSFTVKRLGGATRYDTNLMILQEAGVTDEDVIVCTGKNFADSLSASATGLPILLVKDGLTSAQKEFLDCTSGRKIIIGGENAVSKRVETQLASYGEVSRLAGGTRYDTSVLVAKTFFAGPTQAVIAYGENFPDGLSGGPVANAIGAPLILTRAGKEKAAADYISESGITGGYVLGGTAVLPEKTVNKVFGTK